jgi:hypothetical protein
MAREIMEAYFKIIRCEEDMASLPSLACLLVLSSCAAFFKVHHL